MSPDTKIVLKIGDKKYTIPVNPEEIEVSYPTQDEIESVLGIGEVAIPVKPSLKEVTWESFFPADNDVWVTKYRSPKKLAKAFQGAWKGRIKCRLVITRSNGVDTNMQCMISDFSIKDKGGEPEDLYYSITLREYREYGAQTMQIISPTPPADASSGVDVVGQQIVTISPDPAPRDTSTSEMYVGKTVVFSGTYYSTAGGDEPSYNTTGVTETIQRIETGAPYPYLITSYGWVRLDQIVEASMWDTI